jgi:hypothetical protein
VFAQLVKVYEKLNARNGLGADPAKHMQVVAPGLSETI